MNCPGGSSPIHMIELTQLNGKRFLLNVPLIEKVESLPDTTITLVNGKKMFVRESLEVVLSLCNQFYRSVGMTGSVIPREGS
ncbi:flagellar FlbD family protein [Alteribacillus sp. HJP-4]|uniref:flagellar FlbD family protein n=1 Tax=Alteribacillus sp. HJP-4 TaxID=2775394 RepID=UPI0035CCDBCC